MHVDSSQADILLNARRCEDALHTHTPRLAGVAVRVSMCACTRARVRVRAMRQELPHTHTKAQALQVRELLDFLSVCLSVGRSVGRWVRPASVWLAAGGW